MEKYRILWLDDEFAGNTPWSETVDSFEQGQDEFKIDKAISYKDFEEKLGLHKYDGVILDIFGDICADQTENRNNSVTFEMALDKLKTEKIVKIVYSGKVNDHPEQKALFEYRANREGAKLINKGKMCVDKLFDEVIRPKLEDKFGRDFPEYYEIKESLSKDVKTKFDKVRVLYNENIDKSEPFQESDFDDIRKLIEGVFRTDASEKKIIKWSATLGDCLTQLQEICPNKFVKPALNVIREFSNPNSHFNKAKVLDYPGYGKYVYIALFNELFMCLKWYYCDFLPNRKAVNMPEPTLKGVVEKDDKELIHLGNVLLPQTATRYVGKNVRLKDLKRNTNPMTKNKYPLYAHFDKLED